MESFKVHKIRIATGDECFIENKDSSLSIPVTRQQACEIDCGDEVLYEEQQFIEVVSE